MDRPKLILRMKRTIELLIKAHKWLAIEVVKGPSADAIAFSEELEAVLNKYQVDKR